MASKSLLARAARAAEVAPQLSCQLCTQRKVKCDNLDPCANCIENGVECVTIRGQRLPRGRHVSPSTRELEIRDRVRRLEALVAYMVSSLGHDTAMRDVVDLAGRRMPVLPAEDYAVPEESNNSEETELGKHSALQDWQNLLKEVGQTFKVLYQTLRYLDRWNRAKFAELREVMDLRLDGHRTSETFSERQMRQRLWYTIASLDAQLSTDRVSEPLIAHDSAQPRMPLNINDADFDRTSTCAAQERECLTDMTFALLTYNLQHRGKMLNFNNTPSQDGEKYSWSARQRCVDRFEQQAARLTAGCDAGASRYAWLAFNGSRSSTTALRLSVLRPIRICKDRLSLLKADNSYILQIAASCRGHSHLIRIDPRGESYRWYIKVPWHPLAVAISECYVCDDYALVGSVWPLIEACFEYHTSAFASNRQPMLWEPLRRFMVKMRESLESIFTIRNANMSRSSIGDSGSRSHDF